jgi:hypothetical protein
MKQNQGLQKRETVVSNSPQDFSNNVGKLTDGIHTLLFCFGLQDQC